MFITYFYIVQIEISGCDHQSRQIRVIGGVQLDSMTRIYAHRDRLLHFESTRITDSCRFKKAVHDRESQVKYVLKRAYLLPSLLPRSITLDAL